MKTVYIVSGIVAAVILVFAAAVFSTNNTAIGYEESIKNARSGIQVQEKREYDLITKLVQVVEANSKFESVTQVAVTQARASLKSGNVSQAALAITAVAEQYPDLKANAAYTQLMTELSVSENLKAQFRATYNDNVTEYNRFVRRFPNAAFLSWMGYEVQSFEYLEFTETDLPAQLFKNP